MSGSYAFNGTTSYLSNPGYYHSSKAAIFLWYYMASDPAELAARAIYMIDGGSAQLLFIDHSAAANFRSGWYNTASNDGIVSVADPSVQDAWNSVLFSFYDSGGTLTDKMWINGNYIGSATPSTAALWNPENTEIRVGNFISGSQYWSGRLAHLTVWNSSTFQWTDGMATALHRGAPPWRFNTPNLKYYAPLNGIQTNFWQRSGFDNEPNHGQGFSTTDVTEAGGPPVNILTRPGHW